MTFARRFILAFLMLWLPLQTVAANMTGADCAPEAAASHMQGSGGHHGNHDANPVQDQNEDRGGSFTHDCCHHQPAILSLPSLATAAVPHVLSPLPIFGKPSHLPEPFQRPPRPAAV